VGKRVAIRVKDSCARSTGQKTVDTRITAVHDSLGGLALVNADGAKGQEVLIDLYDGSRRAGREDARLVAWREDPGDVCGTAKTLWSWSGPNKEGPPRRGAVYAGFGTRVDEFTKDFAGQEIQLEELFAPKGKTKATLVRRTRYRYDADKGRYVRYQRRILNRS
jgi:hypothetical protein